MLPLGRSLLHLVALFMTVLLASWSAKAQQAAPDKCSPEVNSSFVGYATLRLDVRP
jgi:hypothetical protein